MVCISDLKSHTSLFSISIPMPTIFVKLIEGTCKDSDTKLIVHIDYKTLFIHFLTEEMVSCVLG